MSITIRKPAKSPALAAPYGSPKLQAEAKTIFTFPETGQTIRVVELDGALWFVAKDVCLLLWLGISETGYCDVWNATRPLAADEKQTLRATDPRLTRGSELFGRRVPSLAFISESGLYKLIMRSDKPVARKFQDWVTREVLPAIRKDGLYVMGEEKLRTGEMTTKEYLARALLVVSGANTRTGLGGGHLVMGGTRGGS